MSVYFVTGTLGSGKGLCAVSRLKHYARYGKRIAGNVDLFLKHFAETPLSKVTYSRVPDCPTAVDLKALGKGSDKIGEKHNGLLVLDELTVWFNSRSWNDKERKDLLSYFIHVRKMRWDVIFLVQSIQSVDKQLIDSLLEYHVPVSNLSKIQVPIIGGLYRHFNSHGEPLYLPQIHTAKLLYKNKVGSGRWTLGGKDLYSSYDTEQVFSHDYEHGTHSVLSRWHLEGRYLPPERELIIYAKAAFYYLVLFSYRLTRRSTYLLLNRLTH